jgi:hypothetical protein
MPKFSKNRSKGRSNAGEVPGVFKMLSGGIMKHLSEEDAVNFVNDVMSAERQMEAQKHLESGCKRCTESVAIWQRVREASSVEAEFQPPAGTVRIAKAAFAAAGLEKAPGGLKLLFDSSLQTAAVGVRSISTDTRQLLYGVGPYLIDLYISARPGGKAISVTGQLMNSKFPERILSAVPIVVGNGTGTAVLTTTNNFGEFQGEVEYGGDLELRLPGQDGNEIVIRLGCLIAGLATCAGETAKTNPDLPRY